MPPKNKKKNPNAALKLICIRHPKDAEDPCSMNHINVLKKCNASDDGSIWPDYKDDPTNAGLENLGDVAACQKLLNHVLNENNNMCDLTASYSKEAALSSMEGAKKKLKFEQLPVTKQMLEHALQAISGASKKKGTTSNQQPSGSNAVTTATVSSSDDTLPLPTMSSAGGGTVNQVNTGLSALQISGAISTGTNHATSSDLNPTANSDVTTACSAVAVGAGGVQAGPPTRIPTNPLNEVLQGTQEVGTRRPDTTAKPNQQVKTNYFRVDIKNTAVGSPILHEYQITGLLVDRPNDLSRSKKKVMIKRFIQQSTFLHAPNASFVHNAEGRVIAWRNLSSATPINGIVDQQNVPDFDRNQHGVVSQNLRMSLVYVRRIDLNDLQRYASGNNHGYPANVAEEALNILLGQAVADSNTGAIQIGDNHFFMPGTAEDLGGWGMVAMRGYTSHVKARRGGLYLNVNSALSAFYKAAPVSRYIENLPSSSSDFHRDPKAVQHLIGLRVRIRYNRDKPGQVGSRKDTPEGRLKTITGFSQLTAENTFFVDRPGKNVSVWDHFVQTTQGKAQSIGPNQICVNTSSTQPGRECWILSDQLDVVQGQIYRKTLDRLDPRMTANMITIACRTPLKNQQSILDKGLPALGFQQNQPDPVRLREAGVSVARHMIDVPSRLAKSPIVTYANQSPNVQAGQWRTQGMKFLSQNRQHFQSTTGVEFFCPPGGLARPNFGSVYINGFDRTWQMNYDTALPDNLIKIHRTWQRFPPPDMHNPVAVTGKLRTCNAGLVVLALPTSNAQNRASYANFRICMDQTLGRPSLVINEERMFNSKKSTMTPGALIPYFANVAMKLNVRLGNINHSTGNFGILSKDGACDTLVLGADLIHPKTTSSDICPTIACVVGSVDGMYAKFLGSARRQTARTEIIDSTHMIAMVTEALGNWQNNNAGRLPARILYYRDGTGDSQYAGILTEVSAIKTAWKNAAGPQGPQAYPVTAVVAVKRHTTRLYPLKGNKQTRTGNIMPGSVIDTHITSPYYFDFYLQSHDVEQGSAKPTLYRVLANDLNFSSTALQDVTNAFCYNFSHSASAVSYASPAYYADRLCERVMLYLKAFFDNDASVSGLANDTARQSALDVAWGRGGQGLNRTDGNFNPWHSNFQKVMFWM